MSEETHLCVEGARVHNLKNINVRIPRYALVVITGLSGSGKSSLAFDTIYAEGQRRYMETFSAYARQFIGNMERPDVDKITGLSPVISIEQKTVNKNPRSTVGTITEIYDFLRLLFARASDAYSYETGELMQKFSEKQIFERIISTYQDKEISILAPLVSGRKGHYRELFEQIRKQGFVKVRVDGEIKEITLKMQVERYKIHDIEIVIDQIKINDSANARLNSSLQTAMKHGKGMMQVLDHETNKARNFSRFLMCPTTGISYPEPEPNLFSFNSPYGACPKCNGLGKVTDIDLQKIIPNASKSIKNGGIEPLGSYKNNWIFRQIEALGEKYRFDISQPIEDLSDEVVNIILYGSDDIIRVKTEYAGTSSSYSMTFQGVVNFIQSQDIEGASASIKRWVESFMVKRVCDECNGSRLKKEALFFKIDHKNISQLAEMDIKTLLKWVNSVEEKLDDRKKAISFETLREIRSRLNFLADIGINYLNLNRPAQSLSGGEAQRIRLATQIGSKLVNVLYILDEPSIGLHQRDNHRLIESLKQLRDAGNSVIVVEHDLDMIMNADYIIDLGIGAGINGGEIVAEGAPETFLKCKSLTCDYISGARKIEIPKTRRIGNGKKLILQGAKGHNLQNVTMEFPLGQFICITGVSGSGKSSIMNETLYPILSNHFYRSEKQILEYKSIKGIEHIDKVIEIDQSPIGKSPRSNPATYIGVFDEIRKLYSSLPESSIRGYKPGRFSFNVKGGRCETCRGAGIQTIEMNFLPDVYVKCPDCQGKRYNRETLEIKYRGKSINDILNMDINQAFQFFDNIPNIRHKIATLKEVGLGYITLGQQSNTLSGGEAQRVKLAEELSKKDTGNTFYILDEPTTGLHFEDVRILLEVLNKLVDKGNTIIVIEHNMDVIKSADFIIDMGPEGGNEGGKIVNKGTPEEIVKSGIGYTAEYLKEYL
ncbi:MAG: excinuclease ABC subunit UvrA [Bacteroidales bacterium]|nr:excinuclease ABC subunit UvrA [Bacteroidales bacterium]